MVKWHIYILVLYGCFVAGHDRLTAQIVNIEDRRMQVPDSIHFMGFADIGGSYYRNDKSLLSLRGNLQMEYYKDRHFVISLTQYNLVQADQDNFLNDGFQHLRYNYVAGKWITWEAFGQVQYNERTRLLLRVLTGAGPRLRLKPIFKQRVHIGLLPMYEYNQIRDTVIIHRDIRLSSYLSIHVKTNDNRISLSSTTYFQPLLADGGNFRIASETSLVVKVLKQLSLRGSLTYLYDNDDRIPADIPDRVYQVQQGIRWDF